MDKAEIKQPGEHKEVRKYHRASNVVRSGKQLQINGRNYDILVEARQPIDLQLLKEKYDPYLDQYDYLVGDVSSEHLRLKGFYSNQDVTSIDKKSSAIADYLIEYCNPGTPYFILHLAGENEKKKLLGKQGNKFRPRASKRASANTSYKKKRVHKVKFEPKKDFAVTETKNSHHHFVIKKRKDNR